MKLCKFLFFLFVLILNLQSRQAKAYDTGSREGSDNCYYSELHNGARCKKAGNCEAGWVGECDPETCKQPYNTGKCEYEIIPRSGQAETPPEETDDVGFCSPPEDEGDYVVITLEHCFVNYRECEDSSLCSGNEPEQANEEDQKPPIEDPFEEMASRVRGGTCEDFSDCESGREVSSDICGHTIETGECYWVQNTVTWTPAWLAVCDTEYELTFANEDCQGFIEDIENLYEGEQEEQGITSGDSPSLSASPNTGLPPG